jgi:hypothetical protein
MSLNHWHAKNGKWTATEAGSMMCGRGIITFQDIGGGIGDGSGSMNGGREILEDSLRRLTNGCTIFFK